MAKTEDTCEATKCKNIYRDERTTRACSQMRSGQVCKIRRGCDAHGAVGRLGSAIWQSIPRCAVRLFGRAMFQTTRRLCRCACPCVLGVRLCRCLSAVLLHVVGWVAARLLCSLRQARQMDTHTSIIIINSIKDSRAGAAPPCQRQPRQPLAALTFVCRAPQSMQHILCMCCRRRL